MMRAMIRNFFIAIRGLARGIRPGAIVALASTLVVAGCARSERPVERAEPAALESASSPKPESKELLRPSRGDVGDMDLPAAERALAQATRELNDALALAAPDCGLARTLRDRICELADRICRLGESDPTVAAHCADGKSRCSDATTRVGSQCP